MKNKDIRAYFADMNDPRLERNRLHLKDDIIFIAISAVLCGMETWDEIEIFGHERKDWFSQYLELPNGIPSHDTFNRFFAKLAPKEFNSCFTSWVSDITGSLKGDVVSIDGKAVRGAKMNGAKSKVHIVSAWANENDLVLGQLKVDEKSNEITAIPELLRSLMLDGAIITIDAMGCQTDIANDIIEASADYILAVKDNQKSLRRDVEESFKLKKTNDISEELDFGHGRIETRKCTVINDLDLIENRDKWRDIKSIIRIESTREIKNTGKIESDARYYISSLKVDAKSFNSAIRSHWAIENKLHWVLDVVFNEDKSRKRAENAATNFSSLNKIAINLLKRTTLTKGAKKFSINNKRLKALLNVKFLQDVLGI